MSGVINWKLLSLQIDSLDLLTILPNNFGQLFTPKIIQLLKSKIISSLISIQDLIMIAVNIKLLNKNINIGLQGFCLKVKRRNRKRVEKTTKLIMIIIAVLSHPAIDDKLRKK